MNKVWRFLFISVIFSLIACISRIVLSTTGQYSEGGALLALIVPPALMLLLVPTIFFIVATLYLYRALVVFLQSKAHASVNKNPIPRPSTLMLLAGFATLFITACVYQGLLGMIRFIGFNLEHVLWF